MQRIRNDAKMNSSFMVISGIRGYESVTGELGHQRAREMISIYWYSFTTVLKVTLLGDFYVLFLS